MSAVAKQPQVLSKELKDYAEFAKLRELGPGRDFFLNFISESLQRLDKDLYAIKELTAEQALRMAAERLALLKLQRSLEKDTRHIERLSSRVKPLMEGKQ